MQASETSMTDASPRGSASRLEKWLIPLIFRATGPVPVRIALGDGPGVAAPGIAPRFTVRVRDLRTLAQIALDPEVGFGDAWMSGRVELAGDLVAFLEAVYHAGGNSDRGWYSRLASAWMDFWQANTLSGSRHNIHSHYDVGNDFYRIWLDRQFVYTCAYFPSPSATLEDAQTAKLDYVCRKLRLVPGETVIEAGCGWGALALHMAKHYGVRVAAFNISREQIRLARERARAEGLADRVQFIEDDYRNASGRFDAFASIGMLEHVGRANYSEFGRVIHRLIGDRGRGLLHFIGKNEAGTFSRWIRKRIFPGVYAPSLSEALEVLEPMGFFVEDVENLRPHYARTLEHWLERFDKSSAAVTAMFDPPFERAWRLYLAGSIAGFRAGPLQLYQILFRGSQFAALPWTRAGLYEAGNAE